MLNRLTAILACVVVLISTSVGAKESLPAEARVDKDALIVVLARFESLMSPVDSVVTLATRMGGEVTPEKIEAGFAKLDEELGFPLREDLLLQLGPEFGLVLDIDDIDNLFAQAGGLPGTASEMFSGFGVFAQVRDVEKVDLSIRKLALSLDDKVTIEHDKENLATIRIPVPSPVSGAEDRLEIVYGIRDGWLAIGLNRDWVRKTLHGPPAGSRLEDGADFTHVMANLDANPDLLAYLNLPALLERVNKSNMVKSMIGEDPEVQRMFEGFANEETINVGWGYTSIEIDGGARASTFGPKVLSAPTMYAGIMAAVAVPNLLNAVDRGKQKRSMADLRSIGTAIESYSIDNNVYPTTDGWQTVDAIAGFLEPVYIRTLPRVDGWGNPFLVSADGESYTLVSGGKDGAVDREWVGEVKSGPTNAFAADIVFSNGQFMRWPEGTQQ